MASNLSTWESETLFSAGIEGMVYALGDQVEPRDEARAVSRFGMLTSILDELSDRFDQLPDLCADWFDLPRGSTFADFADLVRRADARELLAPVRLAYSMQTAITKYYQTGSGSSLRVVQRAIALHHARYGKCLDGSDEVVEIF